VRKNCRVRFSYAEPIRRPSNLDVPRRHPHAESESQEEKEGITAPLTLSPEPLPSTSLLQQTATSVQSSETPSPRSLARRNGKRRTTGRRFSLRMRQVESIREP
jgi:hypothetical protein